VEDRWRGGLSTEGEDASKVASELNVASHRAMSLSRASMIVVVLVVPFAGKSVRCHIDYRTLILRVAKCRS
jgi:hypothetical protein